MNVRAALVALHLALPALLFAGGNREQVIHVYYTSSLNGNLDGCTCSSAPKAGLVKRAAFLRGRARNDSVLLDTGDILDTKPDPELALQVLETYRELGYDAVAVGDQELSGGVAALKDYALKYPLVSHNLTLRATAEDRALGEAPLAIRRGALLVRVVALIDPQVFALYPRALRSQLVISPPADALEKALAFPIATKDPPQAVLTIVLYHGSVEAAAALVAGRTDVDVIIVGHEQRLIHPQKAGSAIIMSPGEEGNRVGVLDLIYRGGRLTGYSHVFRLFDYTRDVDDSAVRRRITEYEDALRSKTQGS